MKLKTQGVKYAGSKLKILPYILDSVAELGDVNTVLDGFSGSTRVSQALANNGYKVTANDISAWSECFGRCYLTSCGEDKFYQEIIDHLNSLTGYDGCFTEHYSSSLDECKNRFNEKTPEN